LHVDVDEAEDSDYGGGYSNQSSDSYEGVALDSSPTPPCEVKKNLSAKTSASGGAKKDDDSTSSERSVSPDHNCDPDWKMKEKKNVDVGGRKSGLDL